MMKRHHALILVSLAILVLVFAPIQYLHMLDRNELAIQSTIQAARSQCKQTQDRETTNECCVPCTTPKSECCLLCSDRATPREHDLLMAAMEGLTHHVMEIFTAANHHGFLKNRAWQGNSHVGNRPLQATFYYDWIRSIHNVTRVCEIGMNGGHSAVIFLAALYPSQKEFRVHLDMFDLTEFKYSKTVEKYIKVLYPGMFTLHVGNSRDMVPKWTEDNAKNGPPCDIFSVDGDHTYEGALIDIRNAANATKKGGYIILDDMTPGGPTRRAFDEVVKDGILEAPKCVENLYARTGYDDRLDETNAREQKLSWCTAKVVS